MQILVLVNMQMGKIQILQSHQSLLDRFYGDQTLQVNSQEPDQTAHIIIAADQYCYFLHTILEPIFAYSRTYIWFNKTTFIVVISNSLIISVKCHCDILFTHTFYGLHRCDGTYFLLLAYKTFSTNSQRFFCDNHLKVLKSGIWL